MPSFAPSDPAQPVDELSLTISPYGYLEWRGSRARLEATKLVPADITWPRRIDYAHWHVNGFEFALRRCRPDGLNGPMRRWMNCDCWFMRRTQPRPIRDRMSIYEPYRDLGDMLFHSTRSGDALHVRCARVRGSSERTEDFKARLIPQ